MGNELLQVGRAQASWNVSGTRILKYSIEMYHKGLNEHKLISAPDIDILQNKVNIQAQKWTQEWAIVEQKRKNEKQKEASIEKASLLTQEAEKFIKDIENLLLATLNVDDTINWDTLKKKDDFEEPKPSAPIEKNRRRHPDKPEKPELQLKFFDKIIRSKKEKRIKENDEKYKKMIEDWNNQKLSIDKDNQKTHEEYLQNIKNWENKVQDWEKLKSDFLKGQEQYNSKIDVLKTSYFNQNPEAIIEYCDMVLNNSKYPDSFPQDFELEYNPENKILIIEYQLPSIEMLPKIKEVKYIASRKELKENYISETQQTKMFDDTIYKITLRTLQELFEADKANALEAISFNGWVRSFNKATGKEENNCIMSIQVKKEEFVGIDLANVDPKICFRTLKGVASSKLSSLTPIQPILQISKVDKRFIEGHEVAKNLNDETNIAAMDWEDFEHLIRELFEKEFSVNDGEVKITQASRDGGVDAVAFDPDPIRGGKIVIQAKRYTNTVGVSAVRDLYGTTLNEGATKGILVTTADYGPDAYDFAKGKPLTLLNGGNLLHILQKHGYHAKIDIKEAKKILSESSF